jgi:predicted unusual protein kinase regulating ubiquinone biosynthesis (AarF/ABC1/UbiB family)
VGRLDRMVGLSSLVGRATTSWVTGRVRHAFGGPEPDLGASAKDVARTLSQLKGVALKAGQQLAARARHLDLPDEVRGALAHAAPRRPSPPRSP